MKKISSSVFFTSMIIWMLTSAYLSIHYIINIFVDTDPYIAKTISIVSIISMVFFATIKKSILFDPSKSDVEGETNGTNKTKKEKLLNKPKCSSCGKK
jgi:hypothetical protein